MNDNTRATPPTGEQEASNERLEINSLTQLVETMRKSIAQLERERDGAREAARIQGDDLRTLRAQLSEHKRSIGVLERERDTLRASLAEAYDALERYGEHRDWGCRTNCAAECTCGLTAAIRLRAASEGGRTDTPSSERKT